jgi:uridine phosphorylase
VRGAAGNSRSYRDLAAKKDDAAQQGVHPGERHRSGRFAPSSISDDTLFKSNRDHETCSASLMSSADNAVFWA